MARYNKCSTARVLCINCHRILYICRLMRVFHQQRLCCDTKQVIEAVLAKRHIISNQASRFAEMTYRIPKQTFGQFITQARREKRASAMENVVVEKTKTCLNDTCSQTNGYVLKTKTIQQVNDTSQTLYNCTCAKFSPVQHKSLFKNIF